MHRFVTAGQKRARIAPICGLLGFVALPAVSLAADYSAAVLYPVTAPAGDQYPNVTGGSRSIAAGQAVGEAFSSSFSTRAILYEPDGTVIDITPASASTATAAATDGVNQVGAIVPTGTTQSHAALWAGTPAAIDLNPTNLAIISSYANSVAGNQQVGYGTDSDRMNHALLWTGAANTAVDLTPAGYTDAVATGTDGVQQVGYGDANGSQHVLLWNGSASSFVDLTPTSLTGIEDPSALAVSGNIQVGYASTSNGEVALEWQETAASAVNLNPTTLMGTNTYSNAYDTNGSVVVGYGGGDNTDQSTHALLWTADSQDSAIDLQDVLPTTSSYDFNASYAWTVDAAGDIFGTAFNSVDDNTYVVEWTPTSVPEPASIGLTGLVGAGLLRRRR